VILVHQPKIQDFQGRTSQVLYRQRIHLNSLNTVVLKKRGWAQKPKD
jgi:hypothetical protein